MNIDIIYYSRKAIYTIIIQQLEIDWAKMTSWESSKEKTTAEQEEHKKLLIIPKTAFHKNNISPKGKNGVGSVMEVFGVKSRLKCRYKCFSVTLNKLSKSHWQLSQILDWSTCCHGWHNQLLGLWANYVFTQGLVGLD